jgi:hypothetical protein
LRQSAAARLRRQTVKLAYPCDAATNPESRVPVADALHKLDQAIARAGGAKVMLRFEEALAIRTAILGEHPFNGAMQAPGPPLRLQLPRPRLRTPPGGLGASRLRPQPPARKRVAGS